MKKHFCLLGITLLLTVLSIFNLAVAQDIFEGKISFSISYLEVPADVQGMESMLPQEMSFYIKGDKYAIVQNMMGGNQTVVTDSKSGESVIMMDMMGAKYAITVSDEEAKAAAAELGEPTIEYLAETKVIAGYICKKANVSSGTESVEVWYTDKISGGMHSNFKTLDGFPLEYVTNEEGMKLKITATSVVKGVDDTVQFDIPDGYKKLTMDEFIEFMGGGE